MKEVSLILISFLISCILVLAIGFSIYYFREMHLLKTYEKYVDDWGGDLRNLELNTKTKLTTSQDYAMFLVFKSKHPEECYKLIEINNNLKSKKRFNSRIYEYIIQWGTIQWYLADQQRYQVTAQGYKQRKLAASNLVAEYTEEALNLHFLPTFYNESAIEEMERAGYIKSGTSKKLKSLFQEVSEEIYSQSLEHWEKAFGKNSRENK